ncbi:MAG: HAMP domain-containing sensor histidine kinase [Polyangiaceae bacterium]
MARSIVRLVEPIARKRGVRVSVTSAGRVLAQGDAAQLEHVVSNLVVNAIQACDDGGRVEISCERDATTGDAERVRLQVSDDGHGMNTDTLERVFEPFFTTKDVGQGTGLGLSVAHGIIEEHGGSISVQSELRHGSTFSVVLPAVSQ